MKFDYSINGNSVDALTFEAVAKLLKGHPCTTDKFNGEDVIICTWDYHKEKLYCMVVVSNVRGGED